MTETTQTFLNFLVDRDPDFSTIMDVARLYINEQTDFAPPDKLREQLDAEAGDPTAVDDVIEDLERDSLARENAALTYLSRMWNQPDQAARIRELFTIIEQQAQLPVIEVTVLSITVMYGMYLWKTGGVIEETEVVQRNEQGIFRIEKVRRYHSFPETIGKMVSVLRFWRQL